MFVYWGSNDSGKAHLKHYAKLNNKTVLMWWPNEIHKVKTTTHINEWSWADETVHRIKYHDLDGFRKCEKTENQIWINTFLFEGYAATINSTINPTIKKGNYSKHKKIYTKEQIKKYTQKEYINTSVYFDIISTCNRAYGDGICKPLTHDTLKNHYDEILEDVDVIIFTLPDWAIDDLEDVLRESVNIIPYKSNQLDSAISKLDHFNNVEKANLFEVYKTDKNRVWRYLDWYREEVDNTIDKLSQHNLPYTLFDLDTDSYPETFGWEVDVDRKFSHRGVAWNHENYNRVKEIAEGDIINKSGYYHSKNGIHKG